MTDYYSILNKTITGLGPEKNTPKVRAVVYDKAREAIEKQLRAMTPAPSEAAIAAQMQNLEDSIRRIESDKLAEAAVAPQAGQPGEPAPAAPAEPPAPSPQPSPPPGPTAAAGDAPQAEAAPASMESPAEAPVQPTAPATPPAPAAEAPVAPTVDATLDAPASEPAPEMPRVATAQKSTSLGDELTADGKSGGGLGKLLMALVFLLLIAGGGYAMWLNKDALMEAASDAGLISRQASQNDTGESPTQEQDTQTSEATAPEGDKAPVRLGSDGEDVTAEPVQETAGESGETQIPLAAQSGEGQQSGETTPDTGQQAEVAPVEEEPAENQTQTTEPEQEPAVPLIGETAYLYEEGVAGSPASRDNGSIAWKVVQEAPGEGLPDEPVIIGQLDIPEKALSMQMKIRRNVDEALPASHIIELLFTVPDSFAGGSVENLPRFVLKPTEQARGESLVAVPARIDAGFFLVALNNLEQAIATNTRLLTEYDWFDIPLGYATGRRALVTFEKGDEGKKVFKQAFDEWANR